MIGMCKEKRKQKTNHAGRNSSLSLRNMTEKENVVKRKSALYEGLLSAVAGLVLVTAIHAAEAGSENRRIHSPRISAGPIIYVTAQGLFYDSIVTADPLPAEGVFQELKPGGPTGLQTEFGPGDVGYAGGRWWMDVNNNDIMDDEDNYFSCPLLSPGRETP